MFQRVRPCRGHYKIWSPDEMSIEPRFAATGRGRGQKWDRVVLGPGGETRPASSTGSYRIGGDALRLIPHSESLYSRYSVTPGDPLSKRESASLESL